jgi:hypothetical protein
LALTASLGFLPVSRPRRYIGLHQCPASRQRESLYDSGYPLPPGHCLHVVKSIYGLATTAPIAS